MNEENINSKHKNLIKIGFAYDLKEVRKYSKIFGYKIFANSKIYEGIELYKVINKKKILRRLKIKEKDILDNLLQNYYSEGKNAYHLKKDLSKENKERIIKLSIDYNNIHFLLRKLPILTNKTIQKYFYPYLIFDKNDDLYYKDTLPISITSSKKSIGDILKGIERKLKNEIFITKIIGKKKEYFFKVTTYFELKKILYSQNDSTLSDIKKTAILNIFKTSLSSQSFLLPGVDLQNKNKIGISLLEFLYDLNLKKIELYLDKNKRRFLDFRNVIDDEKILLDRLKIIIQEINDLYEDKNYLEKIRKKLNFIIKNLKYFETEAKDSIEELYFDTIKNINPNFIKIKKENK